MSWWKSIQISLLRWVILRAGRCLVKLQYRNSEVPQSYLLILRQDLKSSQLITLPQFSASGILDPSRS